MWEEEVQKDGELGHKVGISRVPWTLLNEGVSCVSWVSVSGAGNNCFWRCLQKILRGLGHADGSLSPEELKERTCNQGELMTDQLALAAGCDVEVIERHLDEAGAPGGMANDKILMLAAIVYDLPLMVYDRAAEWGWLVTPYSEAGLRQDAVATLWLDREHFWLAADPCNVETWPLAMAQYKGQEISFKAGGSWKCRAAAAAVALAAQTYGTAFAVGEGDWREAAHAIAWQPQGKTWTVGSINGNTWSTALRQIAGWVHQGEQLDMVLVQEHRLSVDGLPGAQRDAARLGYQAFLSESKPATGKAYAAGVGVLVRSHIGAKAVYAKGILQHRVIGVIIDGICNPPPLVVATYLPVGLALRDAFVYFGALQQFLTAHHGPFILGGDFNQDKSDCQNVALGTLLGGTLLGGPEGLLPRFVRQWADVCPVTRPHT
eukprot:6325346-Amphidinium_carterae.1